MSKFAKDLKSQVQKVVDWVKQSNSKYHEDMARRTAGKPVRRFGVGMGQQNSSQQEANRKTRRVQSKRGQS